MFADRFRGYGLMVVVDHGGKHHSLYAQLQDVTVSLGQAVAAGDVVGTTGAGAGDGPGCTSRCATRAAPKTRPTG